MQYQRPVLIQRQELRMTPQLLQSIQIMTLPLQDLQFRIQEELEANPALELVRERPTVSLDGERERAAAAEDYEYFENSSDPGYSTGGRYEGDENSKRMFMENALSHPESLQEHLLWQLRLQPVDQNRFDLGELLIRNLDENGFHREDPFTLVDSARHEGLQSMMDVIQTFEPVGCCTRDYHEALLVQVNEIPDPPPGIREIISSYLVQLEKGKYREIAKALSINEQDVVEALEVIRGLNPFPGRLYSSDQSRYVIPDLVLRKRDGQFVLVLNDEEIPVLGVNRTFARVADNGDKSARKFAGQSVRDARWFMHSIEQRNQTLLKVARAILDFQRDFFLKGKKHLVPLTLKDIANEVDVSEATVSRVTAGKYLQTEWGIFELKHFFSNSVAGTAAGGSKYSKEGVKEIVREILESEGESGTHLSDQKISDLLAQRGIKIARRTVAKYRKELKIDSSYER
ncbi:MAG: RNA polymerase factor sigma-54 [Alkalispirochaeta sp.]